MHQAGLHLFSTVYTQPGLEAAKQYIRDMGYTNNDVKITVAGNIISIISIKKFNKDFYPIYNGTK